MSKNEMVQLSVPLIARIHMVLAMKAQRINLGNITEMIELRDIVHFSPEETAQFGIEETLDMIKWNRRLDDAETTLELNPAQFGRLRNILTQWSGWPVEDWARKLKDDLDEKAEVILKK